MVKRSRNRVEQSIDQYLQEIGKVPLLSPDEEVELAQRIRQGDEQALEKLTRANLLFVVSVAKKYKNKGLAFGDLINEGNLGLIKAAKRFDETRGFKFISYAVWWIRQGILQALADQSRIVRLPLNRVNTITQIRKAGSELEQELEREPSSAEISERLNMKVFEVTDTQKKSAGHLSLDMPLSNSESNSLLNLIENDHQLPPDSELIDESLKIEIEHSLATLKNREATILRLYFGLGHEAPLTLEEIGERMNLTRERIRQIKEKALRRLRFASRSKALRPFLE